MMFPAVADDDFASFLDAELECSSSDNEEDDESETKSVKRRKVDLDLVAESLPGEMNSEASVKDGECTHPGVFGSMCIRCGATVDDSSGVALGYIHKGLRLANDEIARLRTSDLKSLIRRKKLYLILDLDHTLLNSTRIMDLTTDEEYLKSQTESLQGSLFKLDFMHMMTKLRPYVHNFLKEASAMFEMYIYTMGEQSYAREMAKLLDPEGVYFNSRVISQSDCTQKHQKGLDVILGQENVVLILDDTAHVWQKHKENLILMDRYHFFASSCRQFGYNCESLSMLKSDESEVDGALSTVLKVLKRIHGMFYDLDIKNDLGDRDVRQMLRTVRKEVLEGCKIVFTHVIPKHVPAESHHLWETAEKLGATCSTELDDSVTHVVSADTGTEKSRWAVRKKKFLVHPRWIEAANYLWRKQPEDKFTVS